jgi:hypothetical protein
VAKLDLEDYQSLLRVISAARPQKAHPIARNSRANIAPNPYWVEKIGLGFDLPAPIGQLGQLHMVPKVA